MEEVKKKIKKKTSTTSKVQGVSRKKKVASELSSDELLEQILNKKKSKSKSSTIKKKSSNSSSVKKEVKPSKDLSSLSSDELYDLIKSKKNKKSTKKVDSNVDVSVVTNDDSSSSNKDYVDKIEVDEPKDLIITREITFTDDNLDLNNKKVLKELRQAIEDFDSLDDSVSKENVEIVDTKCVDKKTIFSKSSIKYILAIIVALLLFFVIFICLKHSNDNGEFKLKIPSIDSKEEIDLRPQKYEECLNRPLDDVDKNGDVILAEEKLSDYLNDNYDVSVVYEDIGLGFKYSYNSDVVYYAASTIKSLDALYIYTKAAAGELDLDETMVYSKKYKWSSSREMSKYNYGDKVTLRDLVRYAITVSDNSAHQMLVSYIGRNNLKEFGKSLGATNTLIGSDNFGNISVDDALIYMKSINEFIENNDELGEELQSFFLQADQNGLEISEFGIKAAHKYGEYSYFYHDIGIVYDDNPYIVAILTHEGNDDFINIVKDINLQIYELHKLYYSNREDVCYLEVYGS